VSEHQTARVVGVSADAEAPSVVESVMAWTEGDEVPGLGRAVGGPVDDVVDLEVVLCVAAGNTAPSVAQQHDAAGALVDDSFAASHRHRPALLDDDRRDDAVTCEEAPGAVGERDAMGVAGRPVGVEMDVDAVPFASVGGHDGVERALRDLCDRIERSDAGGVVTRRVIGAVEAGVTGADESVRSSSAPEAEFGSSTDPAPLGSEVAVSSTVSVPVAGSSVGPPSRVRSYCATVRWI